jgi:4-amino-4-deoxy-L-arabinose transferase-like glycosyltransferase
MESALSAVDIWICYFYLSFENNNKFIKIVAIGVLLGLGFFIKSSALIFFAPLLILLTINLFKKNADKRKIVIYLLIILFVSQIISLPLYLEKNFWLTLNSNSRFSLELHDFISLPLFYWINKTFYLLEILFWQLSPMVFIGLLIGAAFTIKKNNQSKIILIWLVTTLFIATVFVRNFHPRYIVSFLPLSALIYSTGLAQIKNWNKKIYYLIIGFTFITLIYGQINKIFS